MTRKYEQITGLIILALVIALQATEFDAWARAGGGRSMGSRGSRSYSRPGQSSNTPRSSVQTPIQPQAPLAPPQASGGGFMRSLAGGLVGGLLGGLLFRSLGFAGYGGMGGGVGMLDLILLAGIGVAIYWVIKQRRQQEAPSGGPYHRVDLGGRGPEGYPAAGPQAAPFGEPEVEQGLGYIRQMDPGFDEARFRDTCADLFFKVQAAWGNRDLGPARAILTPEMYAQLSEDVERFKKEGRINRLENIAVRSVELTEAWQERGQDYATVRFLASVLDYTVDERTGQVTDGSRTAPVKFEEFWTFTRPVGPNPWCLSAINQIEQ